MGNRLAQVRAARGWTKTRLVSEIRNAAVRQQKKGLPSDESIKRRIAVWENQGGTVGDFYRELLCEAFQLPAIELGIVETPTITPPSDLSLELADRLSFSRLDAGLVDLLRNQTQNLRLLDRRLGALMLLQQTTAHVQQIEELVRYALPSAHREAAADELSQAAALAGWQALDMGRLEDAWRLHETAKAAARESASVAGLSYACAQQAYVLLDADRPSEAREMIRSARQHAGRSAPPVLQAWLLAAEGEALACLGDRDAALRTLDAAAAVLPYDAQDPDLPYLMLDAGHLTRWRGDCLARLGEPSAIDSLTAALDAMGEGSYGRAEASLRVDLALAFRARDDISQSQLHARRAADLAKRTGSQRQRRRIAQLLAG
jgi:tetratricopeptide (TPR) repeat protein